VFRSRFEQRERQVRSAPSDVGASEHDKQLSPAAGQLVPEVLDQLGAGRTAARNEVVDRLKLRQGDASRGSDNTTSGGSLVGRDDLEAAPIVSQLLQLERVDRAAFEVEAKHFWLGDDPGAQGRRQLDQSLVQHGANASELILAFDARIRLT